MCEFKNESVWSAREWEMHVLSRGNCHLTGLESTYEGTRYGDTCVRKVNWYRDALRKAEIVM